MRKEAWKSLIPSQLSLKEDIIDTLSLKNNCSVQDASTKYWDAINRAEAAIGERLTCFYARTHHIRHLSLSDGYNMINYSSQLLERTLAHLVCLKFNTSSNVHKFPIEAIRKGLPNLRHLTYHVKIWSSDPKPILEFVELIRDGAMPNLETLSFSASIGHDKHVASSSLLCEMIHRNSTQRRLRQVDLGNLWTNSGYLNLSYLLGDDIVDPSMWSKLDERCRERLGLPISALRFSGTGLVAALRRFITSTESAEYLYQLSHSDQPTPTSAVEKIRLINDKIKNLLGGHYGQLNAWQHKLMKPLVDEYFPDPSMTTERAVLESPFAAYVASCTDYDDFKRLLTKDWRFLRACAHSDNYLPHPLRQCAKLFAETGSIVNTNYPIEWEDKTCITLWKVFTKKSVDTEEEEDAFIATWLIKFFRQVPNDIIRLSRKESNMFETEDTPSLEEHSKIIRQLLLKRRAGKL